MASTRPWLRKVRLNDDDFPASSSAAEKIPENSENAPEEEEEELEIVKGLPMRPTIYREKPWNRRIVISLSDSEDEDEKQERIEKNRKLFEKYGELAKKKRAIKEKRMLKKKKGKAEKLQKKLEIDDSEVLKKLENLKISEEPEDKDGDSDKETPVISTPKIQLKKMKKPTKKPKTMSSYKYEAKLLKYKMMEEEEQEKKKKKEERRGAMKKRVSRSWVQQPTTIMTTETLTRPLIQALCVDDPKDHGSAFELMDSMYGYGTEAFDTRYPWRIADPLASLKFIQASQKLRQQKFEALLQNPPSEDVRIREKQKKTLECLQEIIWLMHFRRHDVWIQKAVQTMTKRSMFHFDEKGEVAFVRENGLSLIKSDYLDEEMSEILEQRRPGDMLRFVVIDGISILTNLIPNFSKNQPRIPIKILINFITHFLLDGHKVAVFLPDFCEKSENVDDKIAFDFLIKNQLIRFISSSGPRDFKKSILEEAEKTRGILVTHSEGVEIQNAVICRPVINRFTDKIEDFLILAGFEKEFEDSGDSPEDVGDSVDSDDEDDKPDAYQLYYKKCRMYSKQEIVELGADKDYQLLMKDQVFLISSLCHLTNFHSRPFHLIKSFLVLSNRFAPHLIPDFMQKSVAFDITDAMENIREAKYPEIWPISAKY